MNGGGTVSARPRSPARAAYTGSVSVEMRQATDRSGITHGPHLLTAFHAWPGRDSSPHLGYFILFLRALHLSFGTESWSWLQSAINQLAFAEEPPGYECSSSVGLLALM